MWTWTVFWLSACLLGICNCFVLQLKTGPQRFRRQHGNEKSNPRYKQSNTKWGVCSATTGWQTPEGPQCFCTKWRESAAPALTVEPGVGLFLFDFHRTLASQLVSYLLSATCKEGDRKKSRSSPTDTWRRIECQAYDTATATAERIGGSSCHSQAKYARPCLGCQSPQSRMNLLRVDHSSPLGEEMHTHTGVTRLS